MLQIVGLCCSITSCTRVASIDYPFSAVKLLYFAKRSVKSVTFTEKQTNLRTVLKVTSSLSCKSLNILLSKNPSNCSTNSVVALVGGRVLRKLLTIDPFQQLGKTGDSSCGLSNSPDKIKTNSIHEFFLIMIEGTQKFVRKYEPLSSMFSVGNFLIAGGRASY